MQKEIIFFDMDNVLVDFQSGLNKVPAATKEMFKDDGTGKPHYDDIP
jgi:FMN phosphatase YigB (HAD superfamily)